MEIPDAIEKKISAAIDRNAEIEGHRAALPEHIKSSLNHEQHDKLMKFRAIVLDWLPARKRSLVELAVNDGYLNSEYITSINGQDFILVTERLSPTLLGTIFRTPRLRLSDLFK